MAAILASRCFHCSDGRIVQVQPVHIALPAQTHFNEMLRLVSDLKEDRCRYPDHVDRELQEISFQNVGINKFSNLFEQGRDF